jgi:hypothetical protein
MDDTLWHGDLDFLVQESLVDLFAEGGFDWALLAIIVRSAIQLEIQG